MMDEVSFNELTETSCRQPVAIPVDRDNHCHAERRNKVYQFITGNKLQNRKFCHSGLKYTLHIRPTRRKLIQASFYCTIVILYVAPIISSFTLLPSKSVSLHNFNPKSSTSALSSSYFPQHDKYIDNDMHNTNDINPQLYRQNYNQLGATTTPSDRQRMLMNSMNQHSDEEDEWESYLNLSIDGDGEVSDNATGESSIAREDLSSMNGDMPAVDDLSREQPFCGDNGKIRNKRDRSNDIAHVNLNVQNGDKSPRSRDIRVEKSTGVDRISASDDFEINANDEESQVPHSNYQNPKSATESPSTDDFRQQFISRANSNMNGAKSTAPRDQVASDPPLTPPSSPTTKRKRVDTEEIEYIKSTIPLTDVIETYNLEGFTRTNTHTAKACCPFHDDNNPSMSIDDNRGLYKCFACGAGGDVFNFIREYDYIENKRSGEDKMGYMQAVEYAAREFGDHRLVSGWNFGKSGDANMYEGMSEEAKEKMMEKQRKKERIREANTAAAAFYTKCLLTLPTAGKARAHLRSRSISPESVREFALGYAPDCYYGDEASSSSNWGEGSLVSYLAEMKFTPDEIVEAGLAVRTKKSQDTKHQLPDSADEANDYSALMDRFRSRVIVPILDDNGQHVIALGGRHLESVKTSDDEKSESFTPAKYINSPESLVFTKKNVLFNKYKANEVIDTKLSETESSLSLNSDRPKGVVIVEGYFDAIALSNVGVKNVVASMGTALPPEQLQLAAEMGKVPGGRVVLCMDGDEAGRNAVARLSSSSSILSKISGLNFNELHVATLPNDIKDPSDFVDYAGGGKKAKKRFEEEVLDKAISWNDWYIERILSQFDDDAEDGTKGSFSDICDEVSTFLATFTNPADRTRRVYNIAEKLVDFIAPDSDKNSTSSSMMRVQFESDILNMASRKAGVREAMARRIEQADGFSADATSATMEKLASGGSDEDNKLVSSKALAMMKPKPKQVSAAKPLKPVAQRFLSRSRSASKPRRQMKEPPERNFVPHFNGFTFEHKTDRDWLGMTANRNDKMHLGSNSSPFSRANNQASSSKYNKQDIVYFNSNRYFGQQFITPEAIEAGYTFDDDAPSSDETIADFMDRKILTRDEDTMIEQAENRLLHALAKFPQARAAMMTVYSASTFGPNNMRWTSPERAWLFLCLTGSPEIDPVPSELLEGGTPSQLLSNLSQRHDCPVNSFRTMNQNHSSPNDGKVSDFFGSEEIVDTTDEYPDGAASSLSSNLENELDSTLEQGQPGAAHNKLKAKDELGILDIYFLDDEDMFPSFTKSKIGQETRAELTVQETVASLLRATAMKRFSTAKATLTEIVNEIDRRDNVNDDANDTDVPKDSGFEAISSDELQEMFIKVGSEVVSAQKSLYEAERSCDRVNSHLLDQSVSSGVQYKLSQASVERLNKMMDEHIASLPEDTHRPDTPGNDASYVFGSDEFDEAIDSQFGGKRIEVFDPRLPT